MDIKKIQEMCLEAVREDGERCLSKNRVWTTIDTNDGQINIIINSDKPNEVYILHDNRENDRPMPRLEEAIESVLPDFYEITDPEYYEASLTEPYEEYNYETQSYF